MEIPHGDLKPDTLRMVIEEYISREGTPIGNADYSMDDMVKQVLKQLQNNTAVITFNEEDGSCSINRA